MRQARTPLAFLALALTLTLGEQARADDDDARRSARATVRTFMQAVYRAERGDEEALAEAVACLDLSGVAAEERDAVGRERALALKSVFDFDEVRLLGYALIPDDPQGERFVLHRDRRGAGEVVLDRIDGRWLFTAGTVRTVPGLLTALEERAGTARADSEEAGAAEGTAAPGDEDAARPEYEHVSDWLRDLMPEELVDQRVFLLEYWQWAGLGVLAFVGVLIDWLVISLVLFLALRALSRRGLSAERPAVRKGLRPFGLLAMAAFWWVGLGWLGLHADVLKIITIAVRTVAAVAGVWAAYRLVDVVCDALARKAAKTESKFDDLLVPLIRKSVKVFVIAFGLVFIADTLEFSISSLLAGLGLGGLAFALAAQDTVRNFFGSLTVVLDRPFEVGDWVLIDGVEGTVEEVGFRSTRIRTFHNSVLSIPNAKLLTAVVDNMGRRSYRRYSTRLRVTYETSPDQLEALCEGIREVIREHPHTWKGFYQATVNEMGQSGVEILIYMFFELDDWPGELRERQRFILDVLRLARRLGVQIAYPTQTLHMVQEPRNGGGGGDGPRDGGLSVGTAGGGLPDGALSAGALDARRSPEGVLELGRQAARAVVAGEPRPAPRDAGGGGGEGSTGPEAAEGGGPAGAEG